MLVSSTLASFARNEATSTFEWQIVHPERRGIRVQVDDGTTPVATNLFDINPQVLAFLTNVIGEGGLWQGWCVLKLPSQLLCRLLS